MIGEREDAQLLAAVRVLRGATQTAYEAGLSPGEILQRVRNHLALLVEPNKECGAIPVIKTPGNPCCKLPHGHEGRHKYEV
jgi:hypothetical protein